MLSIADERRPVRPTAEVDPHRSGPPGARSARPVLLTHLTAGHSRREPTMTLLHPLSRRRDTDSVSPRSRNRRRARPGVERIEARTLLSTLTVNTTADNTDRDNFLTLREAIYLVDDPSLVDSLPITAGERGRSPARSASRARPIPSPSISPAPACRPSLSTHPCRRSPSRSSSTATRSQGPWPIPRATATMRPCSSS